MQITRKSAITGKIRTMELPITMEQFECYHNGELIQVAFSHLSRDQREFFKTGIIQEEWDDLYVE